MKIYTYLEYLPLSNVILQIHMSKYVDLLSYNNNVSGIFIILFEKTQLHGFNKEVL